MKEYLGAEGRTHAVLGHITSADCDDPKMQEAIARHAYISRIRFWARGLFQFITAPISLVLILLLGLIIGIYEGVGYILDGFRK